MVARFRLYRLTFPIALIGAVVLGCIFAVLVALIPGDTLESMVVDSGIAAVVPAAEPPLGITARLVLMLVVGGVVGGFSWFAFFLIVGGRTLSVGPAIAGDGVPVLRRADAHPDAPARRPLFANTDLGTPFLDVKAQPGERTIPIDLDQPIAAFDPRALRAEPLVMPRAVASLAKGAMPEPVALTPQAAPVADTPAPIVAEPEPEPLPILSRAQTFEAFERFDTFDLPTRSAEPLETPIYAPIAIEPERPVVPEPEPLAEAATIHALLDRLERGAAERAAPKPPRIELPRAHNDGLQEALGTLRRLATSR